MISILLAGGENSRFPYPKGLMTIDGERLIDRNIRKLRSVVGDVVISTNSPEAYFQMGVPLIGDIVTSKGPASGIASAILSTGSDEAFVSACDMPYINTNLIMYIISRKGKDATVPIFKGRPEPLFALYTNKAAKCIQREIENGRSSLRGLLKNMEVNYISEDEVRRIDTDGRSFININTMEEYDSSINWNNNRRLSHKGG